MKVMFITSEGFDTPNSINHLCTTLLEDILKADISIYSISSHQSGTYDDIPACLLNYPEFSYDIIHRSHINRNNFIIRYLDEIKYVFRAKRLWNRQKGKIDCVLLQSNPNAIYHSILIRTFLKVPIILNLYDVFPGHAMSIGVMKSNFIYDILRYMQKHLYENCNKIVAMSGDMKDALIREGVTKEKIQVINNWFDDSIFSSIEPEDNRFFKKYNLKSDVFYVQFAGLLGYVFDYKIYLDTAELLKRDKRIKFLLIGDGNQKNIILEEIEKRELDNILYFPWQPLEIISDVYNACSVGLIPLKNGVIGNGIPSKACQLMAAGKVILNSIEESEYVDLFDTNQMGVSITDHNPQHIAQEILKLCDNPKECQRLGENARNYSYKHFSRKSNTVKFIQLIEETVGI